MVSLLINTEVLILGTVNIPQGATTSPSLPVGLRTLLNVSREAKLPPVTNH